MNDSVTEKETESESASEAVPKKTAVILLAHGAPTSVKDIPQYLMNIRGGKASSREVINEVRERYELIGGSSPLRKITRQQADALQALFDQAGMEFKVYVGMRTWEPYIQDVVKEAVDAGADQIVAMCLAPQYSEWSTERYWKAFIDALSKCPGASDVEVKFVSSWSNHPCLIDAFVDRYEAAKEKLKEEGIEDFHTVFTVHSIPEGTKGYEDPYVKEYNRTVNAIVERVKPKEWHQAYQSQGMIPVPWLIPTVEETMDKIAEAEGKTILLVPVGFVCDHIEILYDIDIAFQDYAKEKQLRLVRTESLNTSPMFIEALAGVVWEQLV